MKHPVLACLLLLCISNVGLTNDVYKWTDNQGVVHYGDRPPVDQRAESVSIDPAPEFVAQPQPAIEPTEAELDRARPLRIVMYSRSDCGYCKKARRYFSQNGIAYRERDIERGKQAHARWKRCAAVCDQRQGVAGFQ